jgi:hypothetical protein
MKDYTRFTTKYANNKEVLDDITFLISRIEINEELLKNREAIIDSISNSLKLYKEYNSKLETQIKTLEEIYTCNVKIIDIYKNKVKRYEGEI